MEKEDGTNCPDGKVSAHRRLGVSGEFQQQQQQQQQ
eukprot:COSAG05_NODE_9428_length_624_cov_0.809524_2_plen_35_part_01